MNEDIKPYMKTGLHYRLADVLYRNFIGPVVAFLESFSAKRTAKWCQDRIPPAERSN
jgi:hypothetical protein